MTAPEFSPLNPGWATATARLRAAEERAELLLRALAIFQPELERRVAALREEIMWNQGALATLHTLEAAMFELGRGADL